MLSGANSRDAASVVRASAQAYRIIAGREDAGLIERAFGWVRDAFDGLHPDYEPLDTRYHDLEHTLQGTLCLARLLVGWHRSGAEPRLDERAVRLGLIAILFHDTGYLKARGDRVGTGAKFTPIHVQRSADFAARVLSRHGLDGEDILEIQGMIRCTGVNADVSALRFDRVVDRRVGCALASADLLGQMAAEDYVDKLPLLFSEFAEAAAFDPGAAGIPPFRHVTDLLRQTPAFWERHVRARLEGQFEGVYRFLNDPYPDGPNDYLSRIEANIDRVKALLGSPTAGNRATATRS